MFESQEIQNIINEISQNHFNLVLVNFRIGKLIHEVAEKNKVTTDRVISDLAKAGPLTVAHLYDCLRAYRKFRSEQLLQRIKDSCKGILTWNFIVNNILEAPEGDTEEAIVYWESKIHQAEKFFNTIENTILKKYDTFPEKIRSQIEGLLVSLGYELPNGTNKSVLKIAHISDIHISEKLTSAGKIIINHETGRNKRLDDIQRCLSYAVDKAIQNGCDIALITEPFDRYNPTPNEIDVFMTEILRLAEYMPVVIEPGNHGMDRNRKNASVFVFLKGQPNIFVADTPTTFYYDGKILTEQPTSRFGKKGSCFIHVLPYPVKYGNDNPVKEMKKYLKAFRNTKTGNALSVLLTHVTVAEAEGAGYVKFLSNEPVLTASDLAGFDYVALGHIHRFQKISDRIYYSGNIERIDFDEENQPKGFIIAELDTETKQLNVNFVETPATEMKTISIEELRQLDLTEKVNGNTLYRVVGSISSDRKDELKEKVFMFQEKAPLLIKVQMVSKERKIAISDSIQDEEALIEFLKSKEIPEEMFKEIMEKHLQIKQSTN